jgi:hypothetical protein
MTPEDMRALAEARGRAVPETAPVRDFAAEVAAAYASKEAAYGLSTKPDTSTVTESAADRNARLARESAEEIARLDRESRAFSPARDAKNTIKAVLATYGLDSLSDFLYEAYAKQEVNINNPDAIIFAIRGQEAYQKRFAANIARAKKGLSELDPGSYIELENGYRRLMQSNGLPIGFYDQTEDFTRLLEGDVSASELQDRIQNGFRAVQDADPEVKRQMQELYGVSEAGLAAYFLDPTKAAPILTRQAEAAKIAARAKEQGNIQLQFATAEEIAARGITADEAQAGFTTLGLQQGLYTEMMGEQALTQQQKVGAALGYNVEAQRQLAERKGTRKAAFQGGGGFAKTTGQTSGTVQTGLGVAE